jgi:hypothetical protein
MPPGSATSVVVVANEVLPDTASAGRDGSRTRFKPRPSYHTFGLIWAVHLSILLQTPLNNEVIEFLRDGTGKNELAKG